MVAFMCNHSTIGQCVHINTGTAGSITTASISCYSCGMNTANSFPITRFAKIEKKKTVKEVKVEQADTRRQNLRNLPHNRKSMRF